MAYLAANRRTDRGRTSFGTRNGYSGNAAVTSLAGLAFMAAGNQPDRGKYGRVVTETLRYILGLVTANGRNRGFIVNGFGNVHGPMYGHGVRHPLFVRRWHDSHQGTSPPRRTTSCGWP